MKRQFYKRTLFLKAIFGVFTVVICLVLFEFFLGKFLPAETLSKLEEKSLNCFKPSKTNAFELAQGRCVFKSDEYTAVANINSFGLRGGDIGQKTKKRILIEGDSFAFGFGVGDNETFPYALGQLLPQYEVINGGFAGGFGPDSYFVHLLEKGLFFEPDIVIFGVFVFNDFSDLDESEWTRTDADGLPVSVESKTRAVTSEGYFRNKDMPVEYSVPALADSNFWVFVSKSFKKIAARIENFAKFTAKDLGFDVHSDTNVGYYYCYFRNICSEKAYNLPFLQFEKIILGAKEKAEENGAEFVVILIPADFQVYEDSWQKYASEALKDLWNKNEDEVYPQARVRKFFAKNGILYLDLLGTVRKNRDKPLYFAKDGHFTKEGNAVAAEAIAEFVRANF